ncbi:hypothetical protein [Mesorhizobium sp.]|uniref:hypothetical protein n=1 Tax=Mesorhizobium sp. TaxID=1871066 RepID=UPI00121FE014|nr:hypothetical protein [Mesorhizobium sp.]TIS37490.1 MAG: hypothetical protein E5W95_17915 [Mesorhizobium sp.]
MAEFVVEEMNGEMIYRRRRGEAPSAIQAAMSITGRPIVTGRVPGIWVRVIHAETKQEWEYHFGD